MITPTYIDSGTGMSRLPLSFHPLVDNVTSMNRKIERVQFNETSERVNLQWKKSRTDRGFQNASHDYAIIALPFSMVKRIKLPGKPSHPNRLASALTSSLFLPVYDYDTDIPNRSAPRGHLTVDPERTVRVVVQGGAGVPDAVLGTVCEPDIRGLLNDDGRTRDRVRVLPIVLPKLHGAGDPARIVQHPRLGR